MLKNLSFVKYNHILFNATLILLDFVLFRVLIFFFYVANNIVFNCSVIESKSYIDLNNFIKKQFHTNYIKSI